MKGENMRKRIMKSLACSLLFSIMITVPAEAAYNLEGSNQEQAEENTIDSAEKNENISDAGDPVLIPEQDNDSEEIILPEEQLPDVDEIQEGPTSNEGETDINTEKNPEEETASAPESAGSEPSLLASEGTWIQDQYGYWYRHSDGSYTTNGWEFIDGYWYYFGSQGYRVTGWQWIDNEWYCMDSNGRMRKGWYTEGGNQYYLDSSSGVMARGWTWIVSEWYYFNSSGVMQKGWYSEGGKRYYLDSSTGVMARGWTWIVSEWYYFNSSGIMQTGWFKENGNWYFLDSNGVMARGWKWVDTAWYYFNSSGVMQTGWLADNGKWYYLNGSGAMVKGWQYLSYPGVNLDQPYMNFFNESGEFVTDSDLQGCSHGYATFGDNRFTTALTTLKYYYSSFSSAMISDIQKGVRNWNNYSEVQISRASSAVSAHILFQPTVFEDEYTGATTDWFVNSQWAFPTTDWTKARILIEEGKAVQYVTVSHELGHAFGLTHRITERNSIMCQSTNRRVSTQPEQIDINVINHIY